MKRLAAAVALVTCAMSPAMAENMNDIMFSDFDHGKAATQSSGAVISRSCVTANVAERFSRSAMRCAAVYHYAAMANLGVRNYEEGESFMNAERAIVIIVTDVGFISTGNNYIGDYKKFLQEEMSRESGEKWKAIDECRASMKKNIAYYKKYVESNCLSK
jgi:hypothetical protein